MSLLTSLLGAKKKTGRRSDYFVISSRDPLWSLVSITRRQYERVYIESAKSIAPGVTPVTYLPLVCNAIKRRRMIILPLGSQPEDTFKQAEQWTYATFVVALCYAVGIKKTRSEVSEWVPLTLPQDALRWLDNVVGKALVKALSGEISDTAPILQLVHEAAAQLGFDDLQSQESDTVEWTISSFRYLVSGCRTSDIVV